MFFNLSLTQNFSYLLNARSGDKTRNECGFRLFVLLNLFILQILMSAPNGSKRKEPSRLYYGIDLSSADGSQKISINQIRTDGNTSRGSGNSQNVIRMIQRNTGGAGRNQTLRIGKMTGSGPLDMVYSVNENSGDKDNEIFISTGASGSSFNFGSPNGSSSNEKMKQSEESQSNVNCINCDECVGCVDCVDCFGCVGCVGCTGCINCVNCINQVGSINRVESVKPKRPNSSKPNETAENVTPSTNPNEERKENGSTGRSRKNASEKRKI